MSQTGLERYLDIGGQVTRLSMKLASGVEDSTCEVKAFDPGFVLLLDTAARFRLPIQLAGRTFEFEGQCDSFDASSLEVTLTGNSPAWQLNLTPRYRVFQNKTARMVFSQLGVEVEGSATVLQQRVSVIQNYLTDYHFAVRLANSLGLRVLGDTTKGSVVVRADKGQQVLSVRGEWGIGGSNSGPYCRLSTSNADILVTGFSFSQSDAQESAKAEPASTPETATKDTDAQIEVTEKYARIDPNTGQRFVSKDDVTPQTPTAKAKAKARAVTLRLGLVCSASTDFLAQPGDVVSFDLTDAASNHTSLEALVETAEYEFFPEHYTIQIELKTGEA